MDNYLKENFGYVRAKNSSEEELLRWRSLCWLVKNRKRRFRYTANLSKRSEADAIRSAFKNDLSLNRERKEKRAGFLNQVDVVLECFAEKISIERTSPRKDDSDSFYSFSDEDEESDDMDDVGNTLSDNISEPVHNVSSYGSSRPRITSWQKGEMLGSGSFGTVYEGIGKDGFRFAIKEVSLLDPGNQGKRLLQLQQEISLLSQFDHENIVRYLGSDKDDKKLYIFLELMTKGSLATLYHNYELRDSEVSEFTRQILNGLEYLHDQKVVHRDIKCANILVDVSGSVKLADFGLAKATKINAAKTSTGSAFWMAPEVVNPKEGSYGSAADIWSLGCTVLEMLTRQPPYSPLEGIQALFRIGKGETPPIPNSLSTDARDFILKCLQVNPNDRPSAVQLLDHPFVRKPSTSSNFASPHFNNIWSLVFAGPSLLVHCFKGNISLTVRGIY
ncbi:hypothetical protein BT93_G0430 [Corymbia citriodora subsp. variegata]|nr:hypothetical protein BT93_G0430 [Corymbia citriodora subsp. variegata]